MKMTYSRCMALAIACTLFLIPVSLFAAGQSGSGTSAEEPTEITWNFPKTESWFADELEERFNVILTLDGVADNDKDKTNVMIASGELPDVFTFGVPLELYDERLTRTIPEAMIRENMPNYSKLLDSMPLGWLQHRSPDNENEYIALTGFADHTNLNMSYHAFRKDWADAVGIDVPNYEAEKVPLDSIPKVYFLDESLPISWFEELLVAFRDGDPDGNGKNDTIPYGASNNVRWSWTNLLAAFNVAFGYNLMEDGELKEWNIADGYKDFLSLMNKWFEMKIIDQEFATIPVTKSWEKGQAGQLGMVQFDAYGIRANGVERWGPDSLATNEEAAAGVEVVVVPPPLGPDGTGGGRIYSPISPIAYQLTVHADVDDAKLAKILQIVDYIRATPDDETWVKSVFGKEGVHFTWEGEAWNSKAVRTPEDQVEEGYSDLGMFPWHRPQFVPSSKFTYMYHPELRDFYTWMAAGAGRRFAIGPYRFDIANETNIREVNRQYGSTMNTIRDEFMYKAITGEIDIDAEWDSYVKNWLDNGGSDLLAEYAKAPMTSELRKGNVVY